MSLPNPLPDNPLRWEGWKHYNSPNFYDRLCLVPEDNAQAALIEENCRQLLVWWQKKLPLKNQPSNPLSQLLRGGLDEAPAFLVEARTELLNPESRARIDAQLHSRAVEKAIEEFKKFLGFVLVDKTLAAEAEAHLLNAGAGLGLAAEIMAGALDTELERLGARRLPRVVAVAPVLRPAPAATPGAHPHRPGPAKNEIALEFMRMLHLSKLCLDGEEMTDDQRDTMCNMGESLGLTGGQAEDVIDEYLEEVASQPSSPESPARPSRTAAPVPAVRPLTAAPFKPVEKALEITPLARGEERLRHADFTNGLGMELRLVTSGTFFMGLNTPEAADNEQPLTRTTVTCFFMACHPVTNAQFEAFDPSHRSLRAPWADERHPVVYVNSLHAEKFCQWLSARENRKYRLPTEAEWEYAARGPQGRVFPWGDHLDAGHFANFADRRTNFAWRNAQIDDGFAESAPVGSYPRGISPFGIEDLAGNVFEWCLDFFEPYKGRERTNPRGPVTGSRRIYRGGSWKSRPSSLRATARHFNAPEYSSNDVGFRVICECD